MRSYSVYNYTLLFRISRMRMDQFFCFRVLDDRNFNNPFLFFYYFSTLLLNRRYPLWNGCFWGIGIQKLLLCDERRNSREWANTRALQEYKNSSAARYFWIYLCIQCHSNIIILMVTMIEMSCVGCISLSFVLWYRQN